MEKKLIMVARFDILPRSGKSVSFYLENDLGYLDIGTFRVRVPGYEKEIPFDFESTTSTLECKINGSYAYGNWDGIAEKIHDVDPCHEDEWAENGLGLKDITAELLAGADKLNEVSIGLYDMGEDPIDCFVRLKEMSFYDENNNEFVMSDKVLKEYNQQRVAEQVAEFVEKATALPFDSFFRQRRIDEYVGKLQNENPTQVLELIDFLQSTDCYSERNRRHADFLIDSMLQVADSKDSIYKVSLIACGNPDYCENQFEHLPGTEAKYHYSESIQYCQKIVNKYISDNDLGSGHWAGGMVYKGDTYIGNISYNGRFWHSEEKYAQLTRIDKTERFQFEKKLQKNMPNLSKNLDEQVEAARLKELEENKFKKQEFENER